MSFYNFDMNGLRLQNLAAPKNVVNESYFKMGDVTNSLDGV